MCTAPGRSTRCACPLGGTPFIKTRRRQQSPGSYMTLTRCADCGKSHGVVSMPHSESLSTFPVNTCHGSLSDSDSFVPFHGCSSWCGLHVPSTLVRLYTRSTKICPALMSGITSYFDCLEAHVLYCCISSKRPLLCLCCCCAALRQPFYDEEIRLVVCGYVR